MKIELNAKVKDKITGYEGIVIGRAEYLTGCIQYLVTAQRLTNDGNIANGEWLDSLPDLQAIDE